MILAMVYKRAWLIGYCMEKRGEVERLAIVLTLNTIVICFILPSFRLMLQAYGDDERV